MHLARIQFGVKLTFIYAVNGFKDPFSFKPSVKQKHTGQSVKNEKDKKRNDHEIAEEQHTRPESVKYDKSEIKRPCSYRYIGRIVNSPESSFNKSEMLVHPFKKPHYHTVFKKQFKVRSSYEQIKKIQRGKNIKEYRYTYMDKTFLK